MVLIVMIIQYIKYKQLLQCGFTNISLYIEVCLNGYYFKKYTVMMNSVTNNELDILKYKPRSNFNTNLLMN